MGSKDPAADDYRQMQQRKALRLIRDGGDVRIDCAHRTLWKPDNSDLSVVVVEIYERQPGGLWRRTPTATLMVDAETTIGALATVIRMAAEYTEASAA